MDTSMECLFDRLPDDILHDILSRLSICELIRARGTCVAWHRIISSCNIFQQLYDERNQESWFALTGHHQNLSDICFFNSSSNKWHFFRYSFLADPTTTWLLNGAADGLLLFVSSEGKMVVSNPLIRHFRLLPDTKVSPRLRLETCLKRRLWNIDSKTIYELPSVSINLLVDRASKTFKVMVWGELRTTQVHALIYSSATDTWTTKLCSDIDYKIFREPFHSVVNRNTICFASMRPCMLGYYKTETGVYGFRVGISRPLIFGVVVERLRQIKLMLYRGRIFMLAVILVRDFTLWCNSFAFVGLWQANRTRAQWDVVTTHRLQSSSVEVAAAYDGNQSVLIIERMPGSKMIFLNLDTKVWTMSATENRAWTLLDGNVRQQQLDMKNVSPGAFRAFYLKLKFSAAVVQ